MNTKYDYERINDEMKDLMRKIEMTRTLLEYAINENHFDDADFYLRNLKSYREKYSACIENMKNLVW